MKFFLLAFVAATQLSGVATLGHIPPDNAADTSRGRRMNIFHEANDEPTKRSKKAKDMKEPNSPDEEASSPSSPQPNEDEQKMGTIHLHRSRGSKKQYQYDYESKRGKGSKSKTAKAFSKSSVKSSKAFPKATKTSEDEAEDTKEQQNKGKLQDVLAEAIAVKEQLQDAFNYDSVVATLCVKSTDDHQHCIYDIHTPGSDYTCECRPTTGASIFREVDTNDNGYVTLEEILTYFDSQQCVYPFKYTIAGVANTYDACTADDDAFGFEWCSIRTLADGQHAHGFWKYCLESSNIAAWEDALDRLDSDEDGKLSFNEAMKNARRRRNLLAPPGTFGSENNCNDCEVPEDCKNPIVKAIDGECRNFFKTVKFNDEDEDLLRMLASAMADVYCTDGSNSKQSYIDCPATKRVGMGDWLDRTHLEPYPELDVKPNAGYLFCTALVTYVNVVAPVELVAIYNGLKYLYPEQDISNICKDTLGASAGEQAFDGKDAIQWATYTINQGEHKGKKILAFMGTEFTNVEQIAADIWSTPAANYCMRNMGNEATAVALEQKPDFITGHSLGGIIAEMVCSMTGIPGASFGAIGAFDPFSRADQALVETELAKAPALRDEKIASYKKKLQDLGYDDVDIAEVLSNLKLEDILVRLEYNGLITDILHSGVKFEVVMNVHDIPSRTIGSLDGAACSHIASSCDLRWTWFGGGLTSFASRNFGHSSAHYAFNTNAKWTRGYEGEEKATTDYSKIFLPGVTKNAACDFCDRSEYCISGSCNIGQEKCFGKDGKFPTFCPDISKNGAERAACQSDDECTSGRCEYNLSYGLCHDQLDASAWCNEDSDCVSNYCNWLNTCSTKKENEAGCQRSEECISGNCNWYFKCS